MRVLGVRARPSCARLPVGHACARQRCAHPAARARLAGSAAVQACPSRPRAATGPREAEGGEARTHQAQGTEEDTERAITCRVARHSAMEYNVMNGNISNIKYKIA